METDLKVGHYEEKTQDAGLKARRYRRRNAETLAREAQRGVLKVHFDRAPREGVEEELLWRRARVALGF
jgi:hypothetical protein